MTLDEKAKRLLQWMDVTDNYDAQDSPKAENDSVRQNAFSPHMGEGEDGFGECPSPSVQKPIPSPRAKNQRPSKKNSAQKGGKVHFFEKISLS